MVFILSIPCSCLAANHYVRQGATGNGSGADWTNACTGFTGACTIASLVRGDTYYVADGSYGSQQFTTPASGTSVITIKKAIPADHGTATGWSDTYGQTQSVFGSSIQFLTSYWVFDGQARSTETSGHGFKIDNSATTATELCQFGQYGIPISNVTVRYTALIGRGYGQTLVVDRAFYSNSPGTSHITLQYNYVVGVYVPILTRELDTMLVEYNYLADNNSNPASHAEPWSDSGTDNVTLRYNKIRNPEGSAVIFVGNGGGPSPTASNTSTNWQIYGNTVFYYNYVTAPGNNPGTAGILYCANDSSNQNWCDGWKIYNNTFHNFSYGTSSGRIFVQSVTGITIPIVQDNLWNNCADGAPHYNVSASYNYYRNTTHTTEVNEQIGTSDPFVSAATSNFNLVAHTVAGATLLAPYNTDANGVTRGADGVWDRGAYEFSASPSPPLPPSGLTSAVR